jgi:hypothetical protein
LVCIASRLLRVQPALLRQWLRQSVELLHSRERLFGPLSPRITFNQRGLEAPHSRLPRPCVLRPSSRAQPEKLRREAPRPSSLPRPLSPVRHFVMTDPIGHDEMPASNLKLIHDFQRNHRQRRSEYGQHLAVPRGHVHEGV